MFGIVQESVHALYCYCGLHSVRPRRASYDLDIARSSSRGNERKKPFNADVNLDKIDLWVAKDFRYRRIVVSAYELEAKSVCAGHTRRLAARKKQPPRSRGHQAFPYHNKCLERLVVLLVECQQRLSFGVFSPTESIKLCRVELESLHDHF